MSEKIKILLIEDDDLDRKSVCRLLSKKDALECQYEVETAVSLDEALQKLKIIPFRIILLDLNLPDGNGMNAIKKIKQATTLPIIILTGMIDQNIAAEAIQIGVQDFLVKGAFSEDVLQRSIRYALERSKLDVIKNEFISMASHELRTPMAIIQAGIANLNCSMLGELNDKQKQIANIIDSNAKRLNKIVTNLLDISRLESGQINTKFTKISPQKLMQEVVAGLEKLTEQKGISLNLQIAKDLPIDFMADEELLVQIINNLTSNALRYAATKIIIELNSLEDGGILFSIGNDGSYLPPEDIAKLFQKFSQVKRPQGGTGYKGTGLGLAICKEIITKHNGKIWVESIEGGLTCFKFVIPKTKDKKILREVLL